MTPQDATRLLATEPVGALFPAMVGMGHEAEAIHAHHASAASALATMIARSRHVAVPARPEKYSMSMRMLIDARHPEETRVAVAKGNRIEEFDFESEEHKQLKGNIYLAKVTRVEPSLQAAFIDYGGNRHGFLAFSEIHPDYYQIPKSDRDALASRRGRTCRRGRAAARANMMTRVSTRITTMTAPTTARPTSTRMATTATARMGSDRNRHRIVAFAGRRKRRRRASPQAPEFAPPLQDPGRHPAPPGAAGPGRQGRTRQQGRGTDHLSVARRPILRADAQHVAWRRDQPQDFERRRSQAAEVDHVRPQPAADDGADRPHRRPGADQGRDPPRLRLSRAPVGRNPRKDASAVRLRR